MECLRFVHAADLHLDSPFRGIAGVSPALKERLQSATLGALGRVVDHTIQAKADFLIIAGDIYDSKDRNLRALVSFRKEMERLAERHVPVYIVHGNHDPLNGWGSGFQLPPNVITFGGRTDTEPFIRRGRAAAEVTGVSYTRERVTDNLAASFKPADGSPYSIAVLHANVGHQSGHADYAPATIGELAVAGFNYWALGHVHTRSVLAAEPAMVVYPGNTQGRHPRESGPRGCYQVDVDTYGRAHLEFVDTSVARWAQIELSVRECASMDKLVDTMLEKGREAGAHLLSGAVLDPRALRELVPDFERDAPLDTPVRRDSVYFLTSGGEFKFPITPPFLHNGGNYVVSLNRLGRWLAKRVEEAGITIFTETCAMEVLYDDDGAVKGVRSDDKGLDREHRKKENYQAGSDIHSKITIFAEGTRGSCTKQLVAQKGLARDRNPMTYALGVKELWEVPEGRIEPGAVTHTMGWPLGFDMYGGGWIYGMQNSVVSLGLVAGLDYRNPLFDPHNAFQRWKTHPLLRELLDGGKMVKYGAKTIPEGGFYSMPRLAADGAVIVGDSAGFLNSQRLKGIHLAMKSGMMAGEAVFDALAARDFSAARLGEYEKKFEKSWAFQELWKVRNFHQAFENGLVGGMFHGGLQMLTGGRGLHARYSAEAGHRRYVKLSERDVVPERIAPDGKLTFDKLTDVYYSATKHEENQPSHLLIHDTDICNNRCIREFGNPCQYFCPANVYEMVENNGRKEIHVNASNCVHCKTCDIMDPYGIIRWVPPEGGGGPAFKNL